MTTTYRTPGVYIEEQTGPGVIAGVGTSTAAFIGPAMRGRLDRAERITTFDDFGRIYGSYLAPSAKTGGRWQYLAFAVEGFFANGGSEAYVLRVGNGRASEARLKNAANQDVAILRARAEGAAGDNTGFAVGQAGVNPLVRPDTTVQAYGPGNTSLTVADGSEFLVEDLVTIPGAVATARITARQGNELTLDAALPGAVGARLALADPPANTTVLRLEHLDGLEPGSWVRVGVAAANERLQVKELDPGTSRITLASGTTAALVLANAPVVRSVFPLAIAADTVAASAAAGTGTELTLQGGAAAVALFRPGDELLLPGPARTTVVEVRTASLVVEPAVVAAAGDAVRIADVVPGQARIRVLGKGLPRAGAMVRLSGTPVGGGAAITDLLEVAAVDGAGFVTFASGPAAAAGYQMSGQQPGSPELEGRQFRLVVTGMTGNAQVTETFDDLSANLRHPRFVLNAGVVDSTLITVNPPDDPPAATGAPALVPEANRTPLLGGADDNPATLGAADYAAALNTLRDIDEVNLVCVPDAAAHPDANVRQAVQRAQIDHCVQAKDRFAIIDAIPGVDPSPTGIELQRGGGRVGERLRGPLLPVARGPRPEHAPRRADAAHDDPAVRPHGRGDGARGRARGRPQGAGQRARPRRARPRARAERPPAGAAQRRRDQRAPHLPGQRRRDRVGRPDHRAHGRHRLALRPGAPAAALPGGEHPGGPALGGLRAQRHHPVGEAPARPDRLPHARVA